MYVIFFYLKSKLLYFRKIIYSILINHFISFNYNIKLLDSIVIKHMLHVIIFNNEITTWVYHLNQ